MRFSAHNLRQRAPFYNALKIFITTPEFLFRDQWFTAPCALYALCLRALNRLSWPCVSSVALHVVETTFCCGFDSFGFTKFSMVWLALRSVCAPFGANPVDLATNKVGPLRFAGYSKLASRDFPFRDCRPFNNWVGWDTSAPLLDSELGMIHVPGAPPSAGHLLIDVFDDAE